MKIKNIVLFIYLSIALFLICKSFHGDTWRLLLCIMVMFFVVVGNMVTSFSFEQSRLLWVKSIALLFFSAFGLIAVTVFVPELLRVVPESSSNIQSISWAILLAMVGVDIHFLYSYFLEPRLQSTE